MRKQKITPDMISMMRRLRKQGLIAKVIRLKLIDAGYPPISTASINSYCKDLTKQVKLKRLKSQRSRLSQEHIDLIRKFQYEGYTLKIIREKLIELTGDKFDIKLIHEYTRDIRDELKAAGLPVGSISLAARDEIISHRKNGHSLLDIQELMFPEHGFISLSVLRFTLRKYKVRKPTIPEFVIIEIKKMLKKGYTISEMHQRLQMLGFNRVEGTIGIMVRKIKNNEQLGLL